MVHGRFVKYFLRNSTTNDWVGLRIASESLKQVYEDIELNYLTSTLLPSPTVKGIYRVEGSIEGLVADGETEGFFLKTYFQNEDIEAVGTKTKHTFKLLNSYPTTYYTIDILKELPSLERRLYKNLRTKNFNFKLEPNSVLTYTFELLGIEEQTFSTTPTAVTPPLNIAPSWNASIKINNTTYLPKSVEVAFNEDFELDYRVGSRKAINFTRGIVEITVKIDFLLSTDTLAFRNQYRNDDSLPLEIRIENKDLDVLKITAPKTIIRSYEENSGDELLTNSIELLVIPNEASIENSIVVELTNNKDTIY